MTTTYNKKSQNEQPTDVKTRLCLKCRKPFTSEWMPGAIVTSGTPTALIGFRGMTLSSDYATAGKISNTHWAAVHRAPCRGSRIILKLSGSRWRRGKLTPMVTTGAVMSSISCAPRCGGWPLSMLVFMRRSRTNFGCGLIAVSLGKQPTPDNRGARAPQLPRLGSLGRVFFIGTQSWHPTGWEGGIGRYGSNVRHSKTPRNQR